jgi:hypothetical protein
VAQVAIESAAGGSALPHKNARRFPARAGRATERGRANSMDLAARTVAADERQRKPAGVDTAE